MIGFTWVHLGSLGFCWVHLGLRELQDMRRQGGEFGIRVNLLTNLLTDRGFLGFLEILSDLITLGEGSNPLYPGIERSRDHRLATFQSSFLYQEAKDSALIHGREHFHYRALIQGEILGWSPPTLSLEYLVY